MSEVPKTSFRLLLRHTRVSSQLCQWHPAMAFQAEVLNFRSLKSWCITCDLILQHFIPFFGRAWNSQCLLEPFYRHHPIRKSYFCTFLSSAKVKHVLFILEIKVQCVRRPERIDFCQIMQVRWGFVWFRKIFGFINKWLQHKTKVFRLISKQKFSS